MFTSKFRYRILSLDGGGAKGVYTLGVLSELAADLGEPLCNHFDLIYGTSTGAIIASMIAMGVSIRTIKDRYFDLVPEVMGHRNAAARTRELRSRAEKIYGDTKFEAFQTDIGIVSTNTREETPFIFKKSSSQAISRQASFTPGFGCSIVEALMASTAAYPLFEKHTITTEHHGEIELMDGGYVANNPTLFAIADALHLPNVSRDSIDILSIGVGQYVEPQKSLYSQLIFKLPSVRLVQSQLATSTNTIEIMRTIFFKDINCIRINERFTDSKYATDLLEANVKKLQTMFALGKQSYGHQQSVIKSIFERQN